MGIINVTPDSFSGALDDPIQTGLAMIEAGAGILDIGGESTRPNATPVTPDEEQRRVLPIIEALANKGVPLSIDTRNAATMRAALDAGATIVNDVTALTHDPEALSVVAEYACNVVLMHMRGTPQTMNSLATYTNLIPDIIAELQTRIDAALAAGIQRHRIAIDPGIGFAKTAEQNIILLQKLDAFAIFNLPILIGVSRKSFIGTLAAEPDSERRGPGSLAAALFALTKGAAIVRVHDVTETIQAVRIWRTLSENT